MACGIEVRSGYGGFSLTCDEEAFARISRHIFSEPSVAEAIGDSREGLGVRFISVRLPSVEPSFRVPGWLALIPSIVASGLTTAALIVGYVTIFRWLMRLIG